jgi:hypothetical protein
MNPAPLTFPRERLPKGSFRPKAVLEFSMKAAKNLRISARRIVMRV